MPAQFSLGLDLTHWETWTAPVVGLSSAGLMLIVARMFVRGRKQPVPPGPTGESAPQRDALEYDKNGERRGSIRRGGKTVSVLISNANGTAEPFTGWVRDRSLSGLRIEVTRPVEVCTILNVRTADASESAPWVQVEVKRCRARENRWELGCQFVRTPPYSQLLLFG